jgi:sec-independent protein translocase protein TatA
MSISEAVSLRDRASGEHAMLQSAAVLFLLFPLGMPELLVIFLIIMVLFGATRLPQMGRGLGEGIRNFKKGIKQDDDDTPEQIEDKQRPRPL